MDKKYVLGLLLISFGLTNVVAFLDEGIRTFEYLTRLADWVGLLIYTVLFAIVPLLLYIGTKSKGNKKAFFLGVFGFAPAVLLIATQLQ